MKITAGSIATVHAISRVLGLVNFLAWAVSFYPQPVLNYQRRSTTGCTIDFTIANLIGYTSYTIYTALFLFSPTIRSQYAARHPCCSSFSEHSCLDAFPDLHIAPCQERVSTVRWNDFAQSLHGALLCVVLMTQFWSWLWGFTRAADGTQRISLVIVTGVSVQISALATVILIVLLQGTGEPTGWMWIDVVYTLGYVKLMNSMMKYFTQTYSNYKRKSTVGWSIWAILLDICGGLASVIQLILDSSVEEDWTGITGNWAKLFLGNLSLIFDFVFVVQNYYLYPNKNHHDTENHITVQVPGETDPLLGSP